MRERDPPVVRGERVSGRGLVEDLVETAHGDDELSSGQSGAKWGTKFAATWPAHHVT
jgi:hypothetical protein